ncbi:MAG: hypothetical protein J6S33_00995 [Aeriscardovia sp.]|nr:hypothetical protein [Aeriscardovia sp.]
MSPTCSRSNQQKDAVTAYHGLTAALEACGGGEAAGALRKNIAGNLEFPLYREDARLLDDSNMLVFHNKESFVSWIRAQVTRNGDQSFLDAGAPAILRPKTGHGPASRIPDDAKTKEDADRWGTADGDAMTITHLANCISPREKRRDRGAGRSRQRRYAVVPGAPSVPLRFSHAKWRAFAYKRNDHGENPSPCRAPASAVRDSPRPRQCRRADSPSWWSVARDGRQRC